MQMKRKREIFILLMAVALVLAMCCLAGCGQKKDAPAPKKASDNKTQTTQSKDTDQKTQNTGTKDSDKKAQNTGTKDSGSTDGSSDSKSNIYAKYDGYTYYLDNGDVKYRLATKDGFRMHCFFRSDSPEYTEVVYTMDLDSAVKNGNILTIKKIRDGNGKDISDTFKNLTYTFAGKKVTMKVERDESKLAGGSGDNILSGEYAFIAPSEKTQKNKTSDAGSGSSDARTKYTAEELGKLAQKHYKKKNDFYPPSADVTKNNDGTFTIHLYEKVDNGDGTYHTATSAWYRVDEFGTGKNEITNEAVDITE